MPYNFEKRSVLRTIFSTLNGYFGEHGGITENMQARETVMDIVALPG